MPIRFHVSRREVNPRPLNADVPSNGLIGCFSADEKMILATASEPYQELFQRRYRLHSLRFPDRRSATGRNEVNSQ
jgi:hypothetical protein